MANRYRFMGLPNVTYISPEHSENNLSTRQPNILESLNCSCFAQEKSSVKYVGITRNKIFTTVNIQANAPVTRNQCHVINHAANY